MLVSTDHAGKSPEELLWVIAELHHLLHEARGRAGALRLQAELLQLDQQDGAPRELKKTSTVAATAPHDRPHTGNAPAREEDKSGYN